MIDVFNKIFEEYENDLQNLLDNNGKSLFISELFEARGTNYDAFKTIIDTMTISLEYAIPYKENNCDAIISKNIIIDNTFLNKPTLNIIWDENSISDAVSKLGNCYYDNNKLNNVFITYYETTKEYPNINEDFLKECLWHEMQHIYRQYQVLKNEEISNQINYKEQNYRDLYNKRENEQEILQVIKNTLYFTDINEINSHLNEMIPYLEKHKEINFKNYKEYLNVIPGYDILKHLKDLSIIYNNPDFYKNKKFIDTVGKNISKIYQDNPFYKNKKFTYNDCVKKLRTRINSSTLYAEKQFYKILGYSLDKLQRESKYRWKNYSNRNEYFNIFNEYKKLLN